MGARENLPQDQEKALRKCMIRIISREGTSKPISLSTFKKKYRGEALGCLGMNLNSNLSEHQWEYSWKEICNTPGLKAVRYSLGIPVYRWVGVSETHPSEKKGVSKMADLNLVTSLTEKDRAKLAKTLVEVVAENAPIPTEEAWGKVFAEVGYLIEGKAKGPIVRKTSSFLTGGRKVVNEEGFFNITKGSGSRKQVPLQSGHPTLEVGSSNKRILRIGGIEIGISTSPGEYIEIEGEVMIEGETEAGGFFRFLVRNARIIFPALLIIFMWVVGMVVS